jgi:hypothetical protein
MKIIMKGIIAAAVLAAPAPTAIPGRVTLNIDGRDVFTINLAAPPAAPPLAKQPLSSLSDMPAHDLSPAVISKPPEGENQFDMDRRLHRERGD